MTTVEHLSEFWGRLPLDVKELILPYVRHPCACMIVRARKIYCAEKRRVCWVELEHPELWRLVELYNRALNIQRSFNLEHSLLLYMAILAATQSSMSSSSQPRRTHMRSPCGSTSTTSNAGRMTISGV